MKLRGILSALILFLAALAFSVGFVGANTSYAVSIHTIVYSPAINVEISPANVSFGDMVKGYASDPINMTFSNLGNASVSITPELDAGSSEIFNYTEFSTTSTCMTSSSAKWYNISKWDGLNVTKPAIMTGGNVTESACMRLNLENYAGSETGSLDANLTFWVTEA